MRILVVDDEPTIRELLGLALQDGGHEVYTAANGQEAWELISEEDIPLVITDWIMPGLDGPSLIARIRNASFRRYTYIILLTAKSRQPDIVRGLQAGADDYLTKPFDVQELEARVAIGLRVLQLETRLRRALKRLNRLATYDSTTGLLNRRAILRQARIELNRSRRSGEALSIVLLDIDHFKDVNDRYGHLAGDHALRAVSRLITQNTRPYDLVGRWGGEEFMLLLPETTLEQARVVAERVRTGICDAKITLPEGGELSLRASLGVAQSDPEGAASLDEIIHQADMALYRAKAQGRNRVLVNERDREMP